MSIKEQIEKIKFLLEQLMKQFKEMQPDAIVLHYDSGGWGFGRVNDYHRKKWGFKSLLGFYCGYHYYVENDGRVYQARKDFEEGAHCVDPEVPGYWNKNSVGVCLQNKPGQSITPEQEKALTLLLGRLRRNYRIPSGKVFAHRNIKATECPGSSIMKFLKEYKN